MRCSTVGFIAIAVVSTLSIRAADATVMSRTYSVTGSNFSASQSSPPFSSITESVTITFDNSTTVSEQTTGITLNASSTITPASPLAFTYVAGLDSIIIGGTKSTVTNPAPNENDFALLIGKASQTNFTVTSLSFTVTGQSAIYSALTTSTSSVAAVPEPASLAVLGAAMAVFGIVRRRR